MKSLHRLLRSAAGRGEMQIRHRDSIHNGAGPHRRHRHVLRCRRHAIVNAVAHAVVAIGDARPSRMVANESEQRHDAGWPQLLAVGRLRGGRLLAGRLVAAQRPHVLAGLATRTRLAVPVRRRIAIGIAKLLAQRVARFDALRRRLLANRHAQRHLAIVLAQLAQHVLTGVAALSDHIAGHEQRRQPGVPAQLRNVAALRVAQLAVVFAVHADVAVVAVVLAHVAIVHAVVAQLQIGRVDRLRGQLLVVHAVLAQLSVVFAQLAEALARVAIVLAGLTIVHGHTVAGVQEQQHVLAQFAQLLADVAIDADRVASVLAQLTEPKHTGHGLQLLALRWRGVAQLLAQLAQLSQLSQPLFAELDARIAQVLAGHTAERDILADQSDIFAELADVRRNGARLGRTGRAIVLPGATPTPLDRIHRVCRWTQSDAQRCTHKKKTIKYQPQKKCIRFIIIIHTTTYFKRVQCDTKTLHTVLFKSPGSPL